MKNFKLLIGIVIIFAAFGFTLISSTDSNEIVANESQPLVEIDGRFSENPDAFN